MKVELKKINYVWNKTGMRQIINSPHKTFNKQTQVLYNECNAISNTQNCWYIRPYSETECNGFENAPGHLQDFDIQYIKDFRVKQYIKEHKDFRYWVSEFYLNGNCFVTFLLNKETMDLTIFRKCMNCKQLELVNWLRDYLFEKID